MRPAVFRFSLNVKWSVCHYKRVRYNRLESRNSLAAPGTRNLVTIYMKIHSFNYLLNAMTETSGGQLAIRCNPETFPSIFHRQKTQL